MLASPMRFSTSLPALRIAQTQAASGMKACFQPLGVILPANDWATILPSRTKKVSVANS